MFSKMVVAAFGAAVAVVSGLVAIGYGWIGVDEVVRAGAYAHGKVEYILTVTGLTGLTALARIGGPALLAMGRAKLVDVARGILTEAVPGKR